MSDETLTYDVNNLENDYFGLSTQKCSRIPE